MRKIFFNRLWLISLIIGLIFYFASFLVAKNSNDRITLNRDKLLTIAIQGQVAHPQPSRNYLTTWDGKPKMAIGIGGINYNLKLGHPVFGWANADQATMEVATEGTGEERFREAWLIYSAVGNKVQILSGEAKGANGIVVGKFGNYVLVHFENEIKEKLAIGDLLQIKATGVGLKIEEFPDIFLHSIAPDVIEKMNLRRLGNQLEVPVVKIIPAEIIGQGAGRTSLYGHFCLQTCYPPDIEKYGLKELCFGDLVFLENTQNDYGKGYYKGAGTVGLVCSGPSDISGLGIGVLAILSSRQGTILPRVDPEANIARYLGLKIPRKATLFSNSNFSPSVLSDIKQTSSDSSKSKNKIKTNKDQLLTIAVEGVVQPAGFASGRGYTTTYDGQPKLGIGMASINYTVTYGDSTYGWAEGDHVEPDVTIQGRDRAVPSECALAILACIGNEARVLTGEAKGAKGIFIGRHAGSDDLVWFPAEVKDKLALNDRILIKARGVGLKILGFEDVRINKIDPEALEKIGLTIENDQLVVPVVMEIPGHIMGSGMGGSFLETIDYDIQTTCPETVNKYNLKRLRLGDLVAIKDHYNFYGRGRYQGAVTIGVIIHGFSDYAGHGPGVNPILSALPGRIKTRIDPQANMALILGIRKKL
ncbi:MAG: DUF4438 domain-containing protein [Candidatus Aminicenantes bacterium]|nr:DUF4438 domain-containing protein [Candidatus Aminicenantes bacterium]